MVADFVGCGVLAVLIGFVVYVLPESCMLPNGIFGYARIGDFLLVYVPLVVGGYFGWIWADKEEALPRWPMMALGSIGIGLVSFISDVVVGALQIHPAARLQVIFGAAVSTGLWFATTLFICPGLTFVCIAGWVRSLGLHRAVSLSTGMPR